MAIEAAKLQVVVTADTKGAEAGLQSVNQKIQGTAKTAQQSGGAIGGLNKAFSGLKASGALAAVGIASVGVTAAAAGKQIVSSAIDYESAFAGVRKTVDATEAEFASLSSGIRNMATEIPVAATEIARVAEAAGQLGIQTPHILGFTRTMSDLGVATNMSAEQAATSLARLANITQMPQTEFDKLGSTIVELGNNLATTESEITEMALRIAGAGSQIGLTEAEILSFAGALSSVGIEAQAGGSAISRVMIDMANAVASGTDDLATFAEVAGMSTAQFQQAFQQDAAGALIAFIEGLNGVSDAGGNVFAVLEELGLSEVRVRDALLRASGAGDLFRESIKLGSAAWQENTALTNEAAERYKTTASQIQIMKNALNDVGITLGSVFLPAIADAAGGLADFAAGFSDAVDHLTSESTLNGLDRWQEAMQELGTTEFQMPEPPEETGRRWGHFVSDMLGHDWGGIWEAMRAPDDIMNEFDLPLSEMTDEHVAQLNAIVDAYGDLRPEMGGVTEAQREQAESLLLQIEHYRELAALTPGQISNVRAVAESLLFWRDANDELLASLQKDLEKSGPGKMAGLDDLSMDLLALQTTTKDTSRIIRDEAQAIGEGFLAVGNSSEQAFTQSTATYERFASAFQGNTDLALSSFDALTQGISSGAIDFEQAASLYAGIPQDVLVPAVASAAAELRGKLADATLSEQDARAIEGQINSLKIMFPDLVAEIDGVAGAFGNFGSIQDVFQQNIASAGEGVSEWQGHLSGAESALKYLEEQQEKNGSLTVEQQAQYDALTGAVERYTGGVDDEMVSLIDAEVAKAEFIARQDELNQALADGTITQKEYDEAISEAASTLDPMTAGQMDLAEATIEVIDKLRDFMIELGLIPPDVETDLVVDDEDANMALNDYAEKIGGLPEPDPTVPVVDKSDADMALNDYAAKIGEVPDNKHTDLTADASEAHGIVDALLNKIRSGATMPVMLSVTGGQGVGFTAFADGGISQGGLALVGEEGPEFVVLPKGAEVIPNPETMALMRGMPFLGGFAGGTGLDLTDADRMAIRILGDLEVVLDPASVAQAEADLSALWDARRIAEELGLGEAVIAELDEKITAKQGELDLIGQVAGTAFGEGVLSELERIAASDRFTGIFQLPSTPGSYSLDDIISGEAQARIEADFKELWQLQRIAQDLGMDEWAAEIGQRMKELGLDDEFVQAVINSETGQKLAEAFDASELADQIAEDFRNVFAGPGFGESLAAGIAELDNMIALGMEQGISPKIIEQWESEKAELEEQASTYWFDVAMAASQGLLDPDALAAYAEAGGEQFRAWLDMLVGEEAAEEMLSGITAITDAGFDQLMTIFGQGAEIAGQFVDDIVMGLADGTFDYEQAMALLGQVGSDALIPMLEQIEEQLTVDLVNAILAGNAELEADILEKLRLLGMLQAELDATAKAGSSAHPNIQHGGAVANSGSGSRGGSTLGGGSRGGSGRGGGGGTWVGGSGGGIPSGGYGGGDPFTNPGAGSGAGPWQLFAGGMMYDASRGDSPYDTAIKELEAEFERTGSADTAWRLEIVQWMRDQFEGTGDPNIDWLLEQMVWVGGGNFNSQAGQDAWMADWASSTAAERQAQKTQAYFDILSGFFHANPEYYDNAALWDVIADRFGINKGAYIQYLNGDYFYASAEDLAALGFSGEGQFVSGKHVQSLLGKTDPLARRGRGDLSANPFVADSGFFNDGSGRAMGTHSLGYHADEWEAVREEQAKSRGRFGAFADGGVIDAPLLALMGEAGTEMVQPLSAGHPERERFISDIVESVVRIVGQGSNSRPATFVVGPHVFSEVVGKEVMHDVSTKAGL